MSVYHPELPSTPDYPSDGPFVAELEASRKLFEDLLASGDWEDQGEKEGVKLSTLPNHDDPYALPMVRGVALIKDCTSEQYLATIQLPGMRKRWDARMESGHIIARFAPTVYEFYSVMKGVGWVVWPRDIVGVTKTIRSKELGKEIRLVQTSVKDDEHAPEQSGKTRATVYLGGWQLLPQGEDLQVTYIVRVSLNGSIPNAIVQQVTKETPLCVAKARDVLETVGHAPFVYLPNGVNKNLILQRDEFNPAELPIEFRSSFLVLQDESFEIIYDAKRMFAGGITVSSSAEQVVVDDDGKGSIKVRCQKEGLEDNQVVTITVVPKA